jgi:hypothetical protein
MNEIMYFGTMHVRFVYETTYRSHRSPKKHRYYLPKVKRQIVPKQTQKINYYYKNVRTVLNIYAVFFTYMYSKKICFDYMYASAWFKMSAAPD